MCEWLKELMGHLSEQKGMQRRRKEGRRAAEAREMCVLFGGFYLMVFGVGGFYLTMFLNKPPKSKGRK